MPNKQGKRGFTFSVCPDQDIEVVKNTVESVTIVYVPAKQTKVVTGNFDTCY